MEKNVVFNSLFPFVAYLFVTEIFKGEADKGLIKIELLILDCHW